MNKKKNKSITKNGKIEENQQRPNASQITTHIEALYLSSSVVAKTLTGYIIDISIVFIITLVLLV